jgi:hypothetical protein
MPSSPNVFILCRDLFFSSQVNGAVQRAGLVPRTCLSWSGCREQLSQAGELLFIVADLEFPELDLRELKQRLPDGCRVIVFAPHVRTELFESAEEAGCDRILTRGQASAQLEKILRHMQESP